MLSAVSVEAQRRKLVAARLATAACGAVFAAWFLVPVLREQGIPRVPASALGIVLQLILWAPLVSISAARYWTDYALARRVRPALTATGISASIVVSALLVRHSGARAPLVSTGGAIVQGVIAWIVAYRFAWNTRETSLFRRQSTNDPELADELAARSRRVLSDAPLDAETHAIVSLNLAGALLVRAERAREYDRIPEAIEVLEGVVGSSPPARAFEAADTLVLAMNLKSELIGDDDGYDEAIERLFETAQAAAAEQPDALSAALAARAVRSERLAERASGPEEAEQLRSYALSDLEQAAAAVPKAMDSHAVVRALYAHRAAAHPLRGDLDQAVRECRAAVRRLRGSSSPEARARAMLMLGQVLELRAAMEPSSRLGRFLDRLVPWRPRSGIVDKVWPKRAPTDLMRAWWLYMQVALLGEFGDEARMRLPALREELARETLIPLPRPFQRHTGWMYAQVFKEQAGLSGSYAAEVAAEWADWAIERGDEQQAAEAAWCWVTALTADLRRRVLDDAEWRIGAIQGAVAEAASLLVRAGRLRDAVLTLDMGRAVLLTERMSRDQGDLESRLVAAGHPQLGARWRATSERIEQADRAGFELANEESRAASAEYLALVEHSRMLREVSALTGFEDVDAPIAYDDIRAAASEGPVVYLAAAEAGGFALVVTSNDEPALLHLHAIDPAAVDELTARLPLATSDPEEFALLMSLLWSAVVGPLVDRLEAGALVTLIAGGALAELPLHAAGAYLDEGGAWRDRSDGIVFRYAPNARVLLRAQRTGRALAEAELNVLTVGVPDARGHRRLPHAAVESERVAEQFRDRAVRPLPATASSVYGSLASCAIWHFACHGIHDSESPLDSTLVLADEPLTLRTVFARPSDRRRLAVLSACHSATLDAALPDEVVGFPSAMLQAGFAGVVACQAEADDYATMLLVLAFFERFRHATTPARALSGAQAWLRTATNGDIRASFPGVHEPPQDELDRLDRWTGHRPFASPMHWAMFSYTGA